MKRSAAIILCLSPVIIILSCMVISQSNTAPVVTLEEPSGHFFKPDVIFNYKINVADKEDGMSAFDEITPGEVYMKVVFLPDSSMMASYLEQQKIEDKTLAVMKQNACFNCHAVKQKLAGPPFTDISKKYAGRKGSKEMLAQKIILGSKGVWGDSQQMPAHPAIQKEQALAITDWVFKNAQHTGFDFITGLEGSFKTATRPSCNPKSIYLLIPSYLDHGINGSNRKNGTQVVVLKYKPAL